MKVLRLLCFGMAIGLSVFAGEAFACTCGDATVADYQRNAEAVFLAKVVGKAKSDAVEKDGVEVTLEVERFWKGKVSKRMVVYTGATEDLYTFLNLCATPFHSGRRYIVFAYGRDRLSTDVCAGTGDFPYAEGVIKKLGKGKRPKS